MSDHEESDFAGEDDAKMTIRAAVRYLLKGVPAGGRGDVAAEIIEIVRQAAHGIPTDSPDPFDDELPGG
jgi:hypothetical protein